MKYKFENTKGVIRSRNSKNRRYNGHKIKNRRYNGHKIKNRRYNGHKIKNRRYNGHKIKNRRYNGHKIKDLQCTTWKTKHRTIQTSLKADGEIRCFWRISSSCSTCGNSSVTLVTNPVISHEWGKDRIVITTNGTYPWSFWRQKHRNG
jgi:hypothetical protein